MTILKLARNFAVAAALTGFTVSASADDIAKAAEAGKAKYMLCAACHGMDGKGTSPAPGIMMAPSFFDSELLKKSPEVTAVILLKGIKKDNPADYMGQMMMPLGAGMPDADLANLITYVRSEFAGVKELVTAEQVAAWKVTYKDTAQMVPRAELEKIGAKKAGEEKAAE